MPRFLPLLLLYLVPLWAWSSQWLVVTEDAPPLQYVVENEVRGITTKLVKAVVKEANLNAELKVYPWARALNTTIQRENTLLYSTIRTPEREDELIWIGKLGRFHLSFMALASNQQFSIRTPAEAKSSVIGAMRHDFTHEYLRMQGFADENLVIRSSLPELIDLLYKGLIDSFVVDQYLICDLVEHYSHSCDELKVALALPELSVDVYLAANRRSEPADLARLIAAFKKVKARPEYQAGFFGE
ncbi:substrate-binding periplasmic protein [Alteromonas flava]|uniref:substrate-binding periplasmic protein n=1 Tax=Alteromonas flava TaxID=2048003 RepID=UPI0013DCFF01|nr:transporter substrate-binding domain-containing protein [Alteromonas flava]